MERGDARERVHTLTLDDRLVDRLHRAARGDRWGVSKERFREALEASARKAGVSPQDIDRALSGLHLEDLALACACADGHERAWEYFVLEHRPHLYRAANALDPGGGARDLADALYGELFGLKERDGVRQSLFRYFHGRSSLTTWLRAVLTQRHIDRLRTTRNIDPLPDDESPGAIASPPPPSIEPERARYLQVMRELLALVIAALAPRDRLRLACYYAQELTLAQTGRVMGEHEASASRNLARTRRHIRDDVERRLREEHGFSDAEVAQCFQSVVDDAGPIDLRVLMDSNAVRKESTLDRSQSRRRT